MFNKYVGKHLSFYTYMFRLQKGYKFVMFDNCLNAPLYERKFQVKLIPVKIVQDDMTDLIVQFKNGTQRRPDIIDYFGNDRVKENYNA